MFLGEALLSPPDPARPRRQPIIGPVHLPGPGDSLPQLDLQDEKGGRAPLPAGEALYAFFHTDCPTSEMAWPYMERIRRLSEGGKLAIRAVSQDAPGETDAFNARLGVKIKTVFDPFPWTVSRALGVESVPVFFLVGPRGDIRYSVVGFDRSKMEEFARLAARSSGRPPEELFRPGEEIPAIRPG